MSYTFFYHPLSSFCMKALIGFYELDVPVEKRIVDLSKESERMELKRLWPVGKFPVLRDEKRGVVVPESTVILEYLDQFVGKPGRLVPVDADQARECRLRDRFFDSYIHHPMQRIVDDRLRPADNRDPYGVAQTKAKIEAMYAIADDWSRTTGPWAMGESFSIADCAAAPALFYADKVAPFGGRFPHLEAYFERLSKRPSFARVLEEAKPYFAMFPG